MWVDETEGINYYFALDGLDGIDDDSNGSRCQLFEGLLSVDIDGREPASKSRMRMVPAYNSLRSGIVSMVL